MDLQPPAPQNPTNAAEAKLTPLTIRTMHGDIEQLSKRTAPNQILSNQTKTGQPPEKLPVPPLPKPPTAPQLPERAPEKPKEIMPKQDKAGFRRLLVVLAIILVLGGIGGFLYWWNYVYVITPPPSLTHFACQNSQCVEVEGEGTDQCLADADCLPEEPALPETLIPIRETETIEILANQETLLWEKIKTAASQEQEKGSLKQILIKLTNGEKKYASLEEFKNLLGLKIPEDLMTNFKNYTLFIYQPEKNEKELCQEAKILEPECYGPRLGLVIQTTDQAAAKNFASAWEKTMTDDLWPLILAKAKEAETLDFQNDSIPDFLDQGIRYKNLPISSIALNYAFFEDLLIIGTSKHSLYEAIRKARP